MIENKKILIIGGYGFIGNYLYKKLKIKNTIVRFGRNNNKSKNISLVNLKKLKFNFDILIFCAGSGTVSFGNENPSKDFYRSVISVKETLQYIDLFDKKPSFIFLSSPAVYGNSIKKKLLVPISQYGKNKLKAENVIKSFCKKKKIKAVILRFFSIYGPKLKKQLIWDAIIKFKKKDFTFFGTGDEVRSWMYIEDVVNLIVLSFKFLSYNTKSLNLSSGENFKNKIILEKLLNIMKIKGRIKFNHKIRKGNPKYLVLSNTISKKIGLKKITTIDEGLKKYVEWKKKN